jgi:hypothetical protein
VSGPNFAGLDKGFKIDPAAANVEFGRMVKYLASDTTGKTVTTADASTDGTGTPTAAQFIVGAYQDTFDAVDVATGKAVANIRMAGITRAMAGAAVLIGQPLTVDATGRVITMTTGAGAPAAGKSRWQVGVALTPQATAGGYLNVLLTPGVVFTNGGT